LYTNADITLYSYQNGAYTRSLIKDVFWDEVKQSNLIKSGLTIVDSVKIFIPVSSISNLNTTTGKDIIVKGIVVVDIDNTSQAAQSASLKTLKETYGFITVSSCDKKLYGSKLMQHYQLSCK
jgi:trans-2-enoyl-CoA reductase